MNTIEMGRKLKEARIAKRMTQNQVVGDFITRNMLSQIESGTATPSVKTLEYLCGVLALSADELMPGENSNALLQLAEAKRLLASQQYEEVLAIASDYPHQLSDEFTAILAQASLALSRQRAVQSNYQEAAVLAQESIALANQGIYANNALRTEGVLHLNSVAEKLSGYYADLCKSK